MRSVRNVLSGLLAVVMWAVLIGFVSYQKSERDKAAALPAQPSLSETAATMTTTAIPQPAPELARDEKLPDTMPTTSVTSRVTTTTRATTSKVTTTTDSVVTTIFAHHPTRVDWDAQPLPSATDSYSEPETTVPGQAPQTTVPGQTTVPDGSTSQAQPPMTTVVQSTVPLPDDSQ